MIKRIICDLKYSLKCFPSRKRELFKWIVLRALNETLSPLMVPLIIRMMLDSYETQSHFFLRAFIIFVFLLPIFILSFYIYVYSDAWVIKTMYDYQSNSLEKLCRMSPCELGYEYSKGDISYVINAGAWGMIQLWMKIFRISGPLVGTIVLLIYSLDYIVVMFLTLLFCILIDIVTATIHTKINFQLNEKLVQNQGKKDDELRYFLQELEFLVLNKCVQREIETNDCIIKENWKLSWRKNIVDASFNFGAEMLETILRGYIFDEINSNRDKITSGQIGTINQMYGNVRSSANSTRNQITSLPQLLVPVEKINKLVNRNLFATIDDLNWNEQSKIVFQNLTLSYGETDVIKDLSFEINYGDKIAIIGANGSGKSTILKALLRNIEIKNGYIYINNYNLNEINENAIRDFFGFLPADFLLFSVTAKENINMNSDKNLNDPELHSILKDASFTKDEAESILSKRPNELSGGQAQRVSFGRMISKEKPIYLLDEPTSALDRGNAHNIMKNIFAGLSTYVYTTHNYNEITYSNRVIYLQSGKIVCDLTKEQFLQSEHYLSWLGINKSKGEDNGEH